jgi:hypothetical protein
MELTKKQAIKFKNNPNINPITDLIFTEGETDIYQMILDAYYDFVRLYLEKTLKKPKKNESYYCDNFSNYNNDEKIKNHDNFLDDCNSDIEESDEKTKNHDDFLDDYNSDSEESD